MDTKLIEKDLENYPDYDDSVTLQSGEVSKAAAPIKMASDLPFTPDGKAAS